MADPTARQTVRLLQSKDGFAGCSKRDLEDLAEHSNRSSLPASWPLIQQDTPADACYIILDGTASVSVKGEKVATLEAGAVVGEAGLAGHKLRNATVMSVTRLELLHIDAAQFEQLIARRPALRAALLARTAPAAAATADA